MHYLDMIKNKLFQILYQSEPNGSGNIASYLEEEAMAMKAVGFLVGTQPVNDAHQILYRGCTIWKENDYPQYDNMLQGWKEYCQTLFLSQYYPLIKDITIPTFFCKSINDEIVKEIEMRNWKKAFIKNDVSALVSYGPNMSTWPTTNFEEMIRRFNKMPSTQLFAVRKYIEIPLYSEERYWVLNNKIYHKSGIIPDIVRKAVRKLKVTGSLYYTIDATSDLIIEVNPGESSDRYFDNSTDLFALWFADAFL